MPDTATAAPTLDLAKLDALGPLKAGAHSGPDAGACVMEALSYVAGEPWSDSPKCCCPVIAAFLRSWNDALPADERDALLRPLIPRLVGTRATPAVEHRRALMAADWLVREHTPTWLRLAGLTAHADALAALPEITDMAQVPSIRGAIEAAQRDAAAARAAASAAAWAAASDAASAAASAAASDAAWDAAGDATSDAARAAAWAAAWVATLDAARAAARAAAWVAAWVATLDAARAAARDALNPTRRVLQQSALRLVERMIACAEGR